MRCDTVLPLRFPKRLGGGRNRLNCAHLTNTPVCGRCFRTSRSPQIPSKGHACGGPLPASTDIFLHLFTCFTAQTVKGGGGGGVAVHWEGSTLGFITQGADKRRTAECFVALLSFGPTLQSSPIFSLSPCEAVERK